MRKDQNSRRPPLPQTATGRRVAAKPRVALVLQGKACWAPTRPGSTRPCTRTT
jgi:hypothetical protein